MAFLSDTQRKCDFLLSNNPNILTTESSTYNHKSGPDTYDKNQYDIITKIHNTFHIHIPGFNHTTERLINKKQIKYVQQGTPGPGAYIPIQSTNFIDVNKINDASPQHFLTRSERFKLSNNTITPGPGQYVTNYKQFAKYKQQHKIKGNLIYNVNKGIKSNSSDNNKLKDANVNAVNAVNGDGKDIGPGQYDVCPKWKGNCVDWGKMSIKQVACSIEKEKDNNTTSTNTNSFGNNGDSELNTVFRLRDVIARGQRNDDIRKVNTRHDIFKQVLQQRKEMYMDSVTKMKSVGTETDKANANTIVHNHNSKKPNTVHSKLHLNHFMDTFQHNNIPSKLYQFFGSSSTRFKTEYNHNGKSINEDTPGPGTYNSIVKQGRIYDININPKKHKQNIQHKVIPGINGLVITSKGNKCLLTTSQSEKNIRSSNSNNNSTNNNNTRFVKANNFGSSETRFKISSHEIDSITPGPGAYDVNINNIDMRINKVKHNQIKQNLHVKLNSHEFKTIKQSSDASFGNCEVNEGSQGKTIQGDLDKYIINEKQVPFGCSADRFKTTTHSKIKNTKHLGPGCYIGQIPFQIKTGQCSMNVPFNSTMPRIAVSHKSKDEQCVSNELGPGLYNLDSYYDWNKKSYNVRYVK